MEYTYYATRFTWNEWIKFLSLNKKSRIMKKRNSRRYGKKKSFKKRGRGRAIPQTITINRGGQRL